MDPGESDFSMKMLVFSLFFSFCKMDFGPGTLVKQLNIARDQGGWEWKTEAKCWALAAVTSPHPP